MGRRLVPHHRTRFPSLAQRSIIQPMSKSTAGYLQTLRKRAPKDSS